MQRIVSILSATSLFINRAVEIFIFFLGTSMTIVMAIQVFYRYVLNHSLFWSEEFGRICLVWLTFLGATAAFKRHMHIGIDFLIRRFPEKLQKKAEIFSIFLSMVFFYVLMVYGLSFMKFVSVQKTAAMGIPMNIPYFIIPVSGVIFTVHAVDLLVKAVFSNHDE